jgi:uncharacterized protein with HEPN domain
VGKLVQIARYANERDRKLVVEILKAAQFAHAYGAYPRSEFIANRADQETIAGRLSAMGEAAKKVSRSTKASLPDVPWDELVAVGGEASGEAWRERPELIWRAVKKVVPRVVAGLGRVSSDDPAVAFALAPPVKPKPKARTRRSKS